MMIKNITILDSKIFLLSALLATSLASCVQACENSPLEESSNFVASASSHAVQEVFIDTSNALIKAGSDQLLVDLTKGQQAVKEALRGALEKKLASNYQPIDTLKTQASEAGLDSDKIAAKAFDKYFASTFQASLIGEYIKEKAIDKCANDYHGDASARKSVSWSSRDTQHVHRKFDNLPLSKWAKMWTGSYNGMPFVESRADLRDSDYVTGMYNASDINSRGVAYLQALHTFVSSKRDEYKLMTFGK
jgi:hypothetical protein